jgi:Type I restriction enzyme R protein N terminus (HSDR_N)
MTSIAFTESIVEEAALTWLERLGWTVKHGPEIAPGELASERADFGQVILTQRLRDALAQLNPTLRPEALDDAFRKLTRPQGPPARRAQRSRARRWTTAGACPQGSALRPRSPARRPCRLSPRRPRCPPDSHPRYTWSRPAVQGPGAGRRVPALCPHTQGPPAGGPLDRG